MYWSSALGIIHQSMYSATEFRHCNMVYWGLFLIDNLSFLLFPFCTALGLFTVAR